MEVFPSSRRFAFGYLSHLLASYCSKALPHDQPVCRYCLVDGVKPAIKEPPAGSTSSRGQHGSLSILLRMLPVRCSSSSKVVELGSADPVCPKAKATYGFIRSSAAGERWHYAPMAKRLAQAGILTAVIGYSLYPQATTHQMSAEVSQALSWIQDHAVEYGGSPEKVSFPNPRVSQMMPCIIIHTSSCCSAAWNLLPWKQP